MYLLDTNILSELRKVRAGRANPGVASWADDVDGSDLFVSAVTLEEIEIGVLLVERRDEWQGEVLRNWFRQQVIPAFADRVLPIDTAVALRSARLHVPNPRAIRDAYIAATALVHGLRLVTRNVADFDGCGATLLNPWLD